MSIQPDLPLSLRAVPIAIGGYQILDLLYSGQSSLVYRALRQTDGRSVILKVLKSAYPTAAELTRYRHEYRVLQSLDLDGVLRAYALDEADKTLVLVLEDFGGESLKQFLERRNQPVLSLAEFFPIALQIADILGRIHRHNSIHKDLNSANILINPETQQIKIADFGISSQLTRENPTLKNPNILEGTLAYLSPEQTGRMNRSLDYRTDFYSLGVTFYELLAGELPFEADDALELIHCHIAKQPTPLHERAPGIPAILSRLVLKLMAKTAEDRYQSAWGLAADLQRCWEEWQVTGAIALFPLGLRDLADNFQIPQKLYGREAEIAQLLAAFDRVSGRGGGRENEGLGTTHSEWLLVSGYSGIGKSSLVRELYRSIARDRGYFIAGKFEQFQRNIPYFALTRAFGDLIEHLLAETEEQLADWRAKLQAALGEYGRIALAVVPELETILGSQPEVPELSPSEAHHRLNFVFGHLIRVFCRAEHPLVFFLDDLQWADSATLELLASLAIDPQAQYFLFVGAYRDNEVTPTHPLSRTLEKLRQEGVYIGEIALKPLTSKDISQLLSETLNENRETVRPLAQLVARKTGGNPFFVNEFLNALYREELLSFERCYVSSLADTNCFPHWRWDLARIEARNLTDNVVELMAEKLKQLPANTQHLLQQAACIGTEFDLNLLAQSNESSVQSTFESLKSAIQSGAILAQSDLHEDLTIRAYKFGHDRIQQAAYDSMEPSARAAVHWQIGRLLWRERTPEALAEDPFSAVNHLNLGRELTRSEEEEEELARLNLGAGDRAMAAAAYPAALEYFQTGIQLLRSDCWDSQYDLALPLHSGATEAAYLSGALEEMDAKAAAVLERGKSILDRLKVYKIQIQAAIAQQQFFEAIRIALHVLESLDLPLPLSPTPEDIQREFEAMMAQLSDRRVETLIDLPEMVDPARLAAMTIASQIFSAVYIAAPSLLPLLVFKQVNLSLQYGNTALSSVAYVYFGLLLCGIFNDRDRGYRFGQLALQIIERFHAKKYLPKVLVVFNATIRFWQEPARNTIDDFSVAYQTGLEVGDLEYSANCSYLTALHSIFTGKNLEKLEHEIAAYSESLLKLKQSTHVNYNKIHHQVILNLLLDEKDSKVTCLNGTSYAEEVMLPVHIEANDRYAVCCFSVNKLHLHYLFGEFEAAIENSERAEAYLDGATATMLVHLWCFYDALARLALARTSNRPRQAQFIQKANEGQQKLKQWAELAPENFEHKVYLIEAEKLRVEGKRYEALEYYDRAIAGAKEQAFLHDEALAHELAAGVYLELGKDKFAGLHLQDALYCYERWGAKAKVKDLERRYLKGLGLETVLTATLPATVITTGNTSKTPQNAKVALDLASFVKASQAVGGEIVLANLLQTLMKILLENAGAQSGFLLLETDGALFVEAEGAIDDDRIAVLQSIPAAEKLPIAIINYVSRSQESIVLENATLEGNFTGDAYIQKYQPKSILCVPLIERGKLVSIAYFENNLTPGAFTRDRVEAIELLSYQAAISIENARLYQTLEDKVEERTAQLAAANTKITLLNQRLKQENRRLSAEVEVVKQLQAMVLPKTAELQGIDSLEIAGFMEPADEVGGDYYDVWQYEGGVKIAIGDVTGHGLESGVLTIMAQTAARSIHNEGQTDARQFLNSLNRTLYDNIQRMNSDKSMSFMLLDYREGKLEFCGQHEEILVARASGSIERIDTIDLGFPLALERDIFQFIACGQIELQPGDIVLLYTDGITEAFNLDRRVYGIERLCEVLLANYRENATQICRAIVEDVRQHIGQQKVFDDIAMVVLKQL